MITKIVLLTLVLSMTLVSPKSFLVLLGPAEEVERMTPTEEQQFEDLERTFVLPMRKLPNGDLLITINEEDLKYTLYGSGINKPSLEFTILCFLFSIALIIIILLFWRSEKNKPASVEV